MKKASAQNRQGLEKMVELSGIEPLTSTMPSDKPLNHYRSFCCRSVDCAQIFLTV
jgi:hypothetical protein